MLFGAGIESPPSPFLFFDGCCSVNASTVFALKNKMKK
jgi:hypothetical protein